MTQGNLELYANFVKNSFREVCSELLDTKFTECEELNILAERKVAVVIGMTGNHKGRILLETSEDTTRRITEIMNYGPFEDMIEMYLFIGEFVNIFSGRAITYINNQFKGLQIRLTPPAIFTGKDLAITTPNIHSSLVCYTGALGTLKLDIGFEGV